MKGLYVLLPYEEYLELLKAAKRNEGNKESNTVESGEKTSIIPKPIKLNLEQLKQLKIKSYGRQQGISTQRVKRYNGKFERTLLKGKSIHCGRSVLADVVRTSGFERGGEE